MWGYNSELERTMIIGVASAEQKKFFDHMVALQDTALNAIKPGVKCSDVDRAVRAYFDRHDLMPYWRHHSDTLSACATTKVRSSIRATIRQSNLGWSSPSSQVCTRESRRLSPFRYRRVTQDGIEALTYYPRDLASLTIPA